MIIERTAILIAYIGGFFLAKWILNKTEKHEFGYIDRDSWILFIMRNAFCLLSFLAVFVALVLWLLNALIDWDMKNHKIKPPNF